MTTPIQPLDTSNPKDKDNNDVPNKSSNSNTRSTKLRKMLKIIVNGTAVLQYVLIESLTPPQFYSMPPI